MNEKVLSELKDVKRLLKYLVKVERMRHGGRFSASINKSLPNIEDILSEKEE